MRHQTAAPDAQQEPDLNALAQSVARLLPCDATIIVARGRSRASQTAIVAAANAPGVDLTRIMTAIETASGSDGANIDATSGVFDTPEGGFHTWLVKSLDEGAKDGPLLVCLNRTSRPFPERTLTRLASMGDVMSGDAAPKRETDHAPTGIVALTHYLDARMAGAGLSPTSPIALLRLDLGRVGPINDSDGWPKSDTLINRASAILAEAAPEPCFTVHLGGGSFAIILPLEHDINEAARLAGEIVEKLSAQSEIQTLGFPFDPYIGWAAYPFDAPEAGTLIGFANAALARIRGMHAGPRVNRIAPEIARFHAEQIGMENDLRQAIEIGSFTLNWLPVLETSTQAVVAFEALVRWNRPGHGPIDPAAFLLCAENAGLIEEIDRWVLREACAQANAWETALGVSINVSPSWLETERVASTICDALQRAGLDPARLQIELSERSRFGPPDSARKELARIRAMGVRLVLDDFGTGIGALERLTNYPFDQVKLDRMFITRLGSDSRVETVLRSMLHMIHSLNMTCCAEGVETEEQLGFLDAHGCEEIQGYLIGRPTIELPISRAT